MNPKPFIPLFPSAFPTSLNPKPLFFAKGFLAISAMEVGKTLEEEAGPSSAGKVDEFRREKESEESEVDDKDGFTPGPLLSLKEQLEKDKVSSQPFPLL